MTRGRFITLEGGEGVGKSTQAIRLADAIRGRGHDVIVTREPGGTVGAEAIRDLLMTGEDDRWSARAEALLFAAARADHVEKIIRPALASGTWVVCDRFIDSSRAYQGSAGGMTEADVMQLHIIGSKGLLPDRTLVLSLPLAAAADRTVERDRGISDRFGEKSVTYHASLVAAFATMAADDPARIRLIDAAGTIDEVTRSIVGAVEDLF